MSELREKLAGEVLKARWQDLAPHHARGALVVADGAVDLLEPGVRATAGGVTDAAASPSRRARGKGHNDPCHGEKFQNLLELQRHTAQLPRVRQAVV